MLETMKSNVNPTTRYFKITEFMPYDGAGSTRRISVTDTVGSHGSPVGAFTVTLVMLGVAVSAGVGDGVIDGVTVMVGVLVGGGGGGSSGLFVGVRVRVGLGV